MSFSKCISINIKRLYQDFHWHYGGKEICELIYLGGEDFFFFGVWQELESDLFHREALAVFLISSFRHFQQSVLVLQYAFCFSLSTLD